MDAAGNTSLFFTPLHLYTDFCLRRRLVAFLKHRDIPYASIDRHHVDREMMEIMS